MNKDKHTGIIFFLLLSILLLSGCRSNPTAGQTNADVPPILLDRTEEEAATTLIREGFKTHAGRLPLQEQLKEAWKIQRQKDENGELLYFISSVRYKGKEYNLARLQAETLAKIYLAGLVETRIGQLVESRISTTDAATPELKSKSKALVKTSLSHITPLLEVYKEYPDGEVEVAVILACRRDHADWITNNRER